MTRSHPLRYALAGTALLAATAQAAPTLAPDLPTYRPQAVSIPADARYLSRDGAIRIGGAEHVRYIVERFNARLSEQHPGWRFVDESKGTTSAVPLLTHGVTLFGAMGRAINPLEISAYRKIVGAAPLEIRVAYTSDDTSQHLATSLAVYVNRANPLASLSATQVARILSVGNPQGDYSHWGQLGLTGVWSRRAIHPYGTPEFTGFGTYLQATHLDRRALPSNYEAYDNTEAILERLADDPAGLGVAAIGLENDKVKPLAIIDPRDGSLSSGTPDEVRTGRYPYGRYLYVYLRREPGKAVDPVAREYLRFVLSRQGQAIIASQPDGYLPLSAGEIRAELAKLDEVAAP